MEEMFSFSIDIVESIEFNVVDGNVFSLPLRWRGFIKEDKSDIAGMSLL